MDGWRRLLLLDDDIKAVVAELGQVANAKGFPEKKNKILIFFWHRPTIYTGDRKFNFYSASLGIEINIPDPETLLRIRIWDPVTF